jgi:hypothetical protein
VRRGKRLSDAGEFRFIAMFVFLLLAARCFGKVHVRAAEVLTE